MKNYLALFQDSEERGGWLAPLADYLTRFDMRGVPGARETASNWLLTGIVIVVLVVCLLQLLKWRMKERAIGGQKIWSLPRILIYMVVGLPVVFVALLMTSYASLDFWTIVGGAGGAKSVLLSWLFYVVCMLGCDLVLPWSRTDYKLR